MRRANDLLSTSVSRECMWRRDMKRRKKSCRLQTSTSWNVPQSQAIEMEPAYLAASVRRVEKEVLPMIKDLQRSSWGIVTHLETNWWQLGMRADGLCPFLAASRDPVKVQSNLEANSSASRKGGTDAKIAALYSQVQSQEDWEPKQLPYERML